MGNSSALLRIMRQAFHLVLSDLVLEHMESSIIAVIVLFYDSVLLQPLSL